MNISAFQLNSNNLIRIQTHAPTLDEMTRELPEGFYTTFSTLAQGTKVLGLHSHLERLYVPAKHMGLNPAVSENILRERIAGLVKESLPAESRVRLILTKDSGAMYIGIQYFEPLPATIYSNGVHAITAELTRQSPRVKDTGFISSSIDQRRRVGRDVFEVLLIKNGGILEGMTSNFYAIKGNRLITAQNGILLGVTRRVLLRLARGQGMSIQYQPPGINEKFDEAFLTSSSRGVVPIISIDSKLVGQGRVGKRTRLLTKEYQAYVEERSELIVK